MAKLDLYRIRPDMGWGLKEVHRWSEPIAVRDSIPIHHEVPNLTVRACVFWKGGEKTRGQQLFLDWHDLGMGALTIEMDLTEMRILRDQINDVLNYPGKTLDKHSERFDSIIEEESK